MTRTLGGGLVPGSVILVAGDPGIGKSTLLLDVASDVAAHGQALYVTGEESSAQVKMRADRLGIDADDLYLLPSTGLEDVLAQMDRLKPALVVIDSIQTITSGDLPSEAGSMAQIRECARTLTEWAKTSGASVVLTGHVTKDGGIAGPRALEHVVDVVLYLEGDPLSSFRLLRAVKNRFGSTNEVGIFEMTEKGMRDVGDPSAHLLNQSSGESVGSVIVPAMEGSRTLLLEVQALTNSFAASYSQKGGLGGGLQQDAADMRGADKARGYILGVAGRDSERGGRHESSGTRSRLGDGPGNSFERARRADSSRDGGCGGTGIERGDKVSRPVGASSA